MPAQKIMLKKGQNPLEMDFTVHQPPYGMIIVVGVILLCSGLTCIATLMFAMGAFK